MQILKQSTAIDVRVGPAMDKDNGVTPVTSASIGSADQADILKADGAATVTMAGVLAAVTNVDGWYDYTMSTSDTDTVGTLDLVLQDASLMLPIFARFQVVEEAVFIALYQASAAGWLSTATITVAEQTQGAPPVAPTFEEILSYLYTEWVRNKIITDTSGADFKKVFADNGSTVLYKKSLLDSASVFTLGEAETGP